MSYARNLARLSRSGAPTVDTAQDLRDLPVYAGLYPARVVTVGAGAKEDGGGGEWAWYEASTDVDNLGTVLAPTGGSTGRWHRIREVNEVNASWWGLFDDGVTDNYPQIQAAIDFAESSRVDFGMSRGIGIAVMLPQGLFYLSQALEISEHAISLAGQPGRGSNLLCDTGGVKISSDVTVTRLANHTLSHINFISKSRDNTSAAIYMWGNYHAVINQCEFWDYYIAIDLHRASLVTIEKCWFVNQSRTTPAKAALKIQGIAEGVPGETGLRTCNNIHFVDNDIQGQQSATAFSEYGILVYSCDGVYVNNSHINHVVVGLSLQNQATAADRGLNSVHCVNTYFDAAYPGDGSLVPRNLEVIGQVANDIVLADGSTADSLCEDYRFTGCYFRSGGLTINNFYFEVEDLNTWRDYHYCRDVIFTGCSLRNALQQSVMIPDGDSNVRPWALIIDGNSISKYGGQGATPALIIRAESAIISNNVFDSDGVPVYNTINIMTPTASAVVSGNDFSKAELREGYEQVYLDTSSETGSIVAEGNVYGGFGMSISRQTHTTTVDDTPTTIGSHEVYHDRAGSIEVTILGKTDDGAGMFSGRYKAQFRRPGYGDVYLSTGTQLLDAYDIYNPNSLPVLPVVGIPTGTQLITAVVTAKADKHWHWAMDVNASQL